VLTLVPEGVALDLVADGTAARDTSTHCAQRFPASALTGRRCELKLTYFRSSARGFSKYAATATRSC
jgi:hypothetical protein